VATNNPMFGGVPGADLATTAAATAVSPWLTGGLAIADTIAGGLFGGGGQEQPRNTTTYTTGVADQTLNTDQNQWGQDNSFSNAQGYNNQQGNTFNNATNAGVTGGQNTGYANTIGLTTGGGTEAGTSTGTQQVQLRDYNANEQAVNAAIGQNLPGMYGNLTAESQNQYVQDLQKGMAEQGLRNVGETFDRAGADQKLAMARTGTGPGSIAASQAAELAHQRGIAESDVQTNARLAAESAAGQRAAVNQGAAGTMAGTMTGIEGSRQVLGSANTGTFAGQSTNLQNTSQGTNTGQNFSGYSNDTSSQAGGFSNTGQSGQNVVGGSNTQGGSSVNQTSNSQQNTGSATYPTENTKPLSLTIGQVPGSLYNSATPGSPYATGGSAWNPGGNSGNPLDWTTGGGNGFNYGNGSAMPGMVAPGSNFNVPGLSGNAVGQPLPGASAPGVGSTMFGPYPQPQPGGTGYVPPAPPGTTLPAPRGAQTPGGPGAMVQPMPTPVPAPVGKQPWPPIMGGAQQF